MKLSFSKCSGPLLAALVHCGLAVAASNSSDEPTLQLSSDPTFNFGLLIPLGEAITAGSDIGPILAAAKNIKPGDMSSFSEVFYGLANLTKAEAENPDNAYDPINVRDTWFSTANYFRRADFYIHRNWSNPLIYSLWDEQTAAYNKAIAALSIPGERVQIQATEGNFTIEAIWYAASKSKTTKLPTLVIGNGFDAAQEESYHNFVAPALARGWNCITYEGPGQPTVRRNQNIGFIPQWERVATPVVDYLLEKKASVVDKDRLAIIGNSFGGYLAARATAFDPRISAAVLIDGVWDTYAGYAPQLKPELLALYEEGRYAQFDREVLAQRDTGNLSTAATWGLDQGLWAFVTHSPTDFFNRVKQFGVKDFIDKIKVPVFVGNAEYETNFIGQPKQVKDALGDKATLHNFNGSAGYHCQTGAGQELSRAIFAWLNKTLGAKGGN